MSLLSRESGETATGMDTVDNNNVDETVSIAAKRLVQTCKRDGNKNGDVSNDFQVVTRERSSLDDILETVAHGDDGAVPHAFLGNDANKNVADLLNDNAHDSGVESPLENSLGTDSDCEKKERHVSLDVICDEVRSSSESGTENLPDIRTSLSDDEDSKEDCVMMGVKPSMVTALAGPEVADSLGGSVLHRPLLVNGDSLEIDENISVIEDSHDSCGDSRPASRRRKSTPKKRTYTPMAYDDSSSDSDSYGDLDEAMEGADEMHILNAMERDGSTEPPSILMEDDSPMHDLELSRDHTDLSRSTEDVSVALVMQDNLTQEATTMRPRGLPSKGKMAEGLKKAEHKCPFCNFAYTSVNYVLSHLYRAHTDVDPVVLQNAIAQVTTWYKASATAKLLEQHAEGTLPNPDESAIAALKNQTLDCVDGPLISSSDSYNQFPEPQNTIVNGVAVMNTIPPKEKDVTHTHSRRTLMTQSYSCDKCNAKFKLHSQLETHMKRHRCSTPFPCNLCGMVFFSQENLTEHKRTHLKESLLSCDTCSAQFRDEVQFLEHQKTHNLKHDCVHCGRQYNDALTLTSHLKDHITEGPIRCEKCDLWFADKATLGQHLQIHGSDQLYQCQFCAYTFTEMAVLRRHTESHLKLEIIELLLNGENPNKKLDKSKTGDVDKTSDSTKKGKEANKENDENLPKDGVQYTCCLCPMTFPTISVLLDHVYKAHSIINDNVRAMQQLLGLATASMPLPMTPDMMNMNAALLGQTPVFNLAGLYPQMLLNKPVVFGNPLDQSKQNIQNVNFIQNPGVLLNLQSPNAMMTSQPLLATKEQKIAPMAEQKTISDIIKPKDHATKSQPVSGQSLLLTSQSPVMTSAGLVTTSADSTHKSTVNVQQQNGHYIDIKVPSFKAGSQPSLLSPTDSLSPQSQKSLLNNHLLLPAKRIKLEDNVLNQKTPEKGLDQVDGLPLESKTGASPSLRAPLLSSMIAKPEASQVTVTPRHFGFESEVDKPFSCDECGKRFKRNCHLQLHMRTHTDDLRAYRCSQCGMKFIQLRSLEMHLKTHSIEKPYNCQFCGKSFAQKYNLKLHIRTHTGEKPYGCAYCEMRFADPGSLNRHTRTHTGEKPYKCEHCGKKFAQKYNLHLHLRIHTHERPFRCVYCDKRFVQKNNLLLHLKVHAEIAVQNGVAPTPIDSSGNQIPDSEDSNNLVIDLALINDQTTIPDAALQKQVVESHMHAESKLNAEHLLQQSEQLISSMTQTQINEGTASVTV